MWLCRSGNNFILGKIRKHTLAGGTMTNKNLEYFFEFDTP